MRLIEFDDHLERLAACGGFGAAREKAKQMSLQSNVLLARPVGLASGFVGFCLCRLAPSS